MWNTAAPILEGENEAELREEFARLVAKYPNQDPFQIGAHIFSKLKDPGLRGEQSAMVWMKDLEVLEMIERFKNGQGVGTVASKDDAARLAWALANDGGVEPKDRVKALELFGHLNGMIVKAVDKKIEDLTPRRMPTIVFERYAD